MAVAHDAEKVNFVRGTSSVATNAKWLSVYHFRRNSASRSALLATVGALDAGTKKPTPELGKLKRRKSPTGQNRLR
jgi:hypothetical protein